MSKDTVRGILKEYGIHPSKRFGQSFLEDPNIIRKIIEVSDIRKDDVVIEIGAGLGIMTGLIAQKAKKVVAIEIDRRLVQVLYDRFECTSNVEVVLDDILSYNIASHVSDATSKKLLIIGNIPYNISSQILYKLLEYRHYISSMVLMFQKEVADRILASPGSKRYGIPSVIVSMYCDTFKITPVSASCFYPKPEVTSAVIKVSVREKTLINLINDSYFNKIVKIAFSKRRKTIGNNLRSANPGYSEEEIDALLEQIGVDKNRRGETLSAEEFGKICNALYEKGIYL